MNPDLFAQVSNFTMTPLVAVAALAEAVERISREGVPGALVECGVWRGGSVMVMAERLLALGDLRELYLFDTFAGMEAPGEWDEKGAHQLYQQSVNAGRPLCRASLDEVATNIASTGYPLRRVHFVIGRVEDTLQTQAPETIALLRLDTDWYASTRHELETLYPRLAPGGALLVDDYGEWDGCRRAVDEYFGGAPRDLLTVDRTVRLLWKPAGGAA
jgi:O-methyltransferase